MVAEILLLGSGSVARACGVILGGGLVALPTDTVYGLACDPRSERAVARLFEAKRREPRPIPIICSDVESAARLVRIDGLALRLATRYWPGALTLVLPAIVTLPSMIDQGTRRIGVRVPAGADLQALIRCCGGAVTGTSANLSGRPSCRSAMEVKESMGDSVDLIIDGGVLTAVESTVVLVAGEGAQVIRQGAIHLDPSLLG